MNVFAAWIWSIGIYYTLFVVFGVSVKFFCFPYTHKNSPCIHNLKKNTTWYMSSLITFLSSGLYFMHNFDTDWWQDNFDTRIAFLILNLVLMCITLVGVLVFGFKYVWFARTFFKKKTD